MTRFDPKAIAIAMVLALMLDVVGAVIFQTVFGGELRDGMSSEQVKAAIEAMQQNTAYLLASLAYGTGTTVVGGYVAARLARAYPYFNALAVGVIGIVLSLMLTSVTPGWFDALAYLITLPAAVLGGHLGQRRNQ